MPEPLPLPLPSFRYGSFPSLGCVFELILGCD